MNKLESVDEHDEAEDRWNIVPNRADLRRAGLTLPRRRTGFIRRLAIKHARSYKPWKKADDEALA